MHPLSGKKQSPEHIQKRVAAIAKTKAAWPESKHVEYRARVRAANDRRPEEIKNAFRFTNVGRIPWNKGNDWRSNLSPEEVRAKAAERARVRRAKNPGLRVHGSMSAMIRNALGQKKAGRSWENIVGYTLEDLMHHLEAQFTYGMSFENYGDWQIDHIKPRVSFSFSDSGDSDFLKCWSLNNLQPLWAIDNLRKGIY